MATALSLIAITGRPRSGVFEALAEWERVMVADRSHADFTRCDDSKTENADTFPWFLEVALSGGGHRATAYALGALLYLVHANLNKKVRNIASVSGASITNAFVASRCDLQTVEIGEFREIAAELIARLERRGLLSVWTTWLCVTAVVALTIVFSSLFGWIWWNFVSTSPSLDGFGGFMMLLIILSVPLAFRGWIIDRWMAAVYFGPRKTTLRLHNISGRSVDHVFCATDLHFGEPFFFSSFFGGRQISESYGRADAPYLPLQTVVRASSAFPPLIPAVLHYPYHEFLRRNDASGKYEYESGPPYIWLTDGGTFNNFATDWHTIRWRVFEFDCEYAKKKYSDPEARRNAQLLSRVSYGDVQLIVDASQPERWKHIPDFGLHILELLRYVFRTMNIMYGSTLAGRSRQAHVATFARMRRSPGRWFAGKLADENQNPEERAREYLEEGALKIYIPYGERLDRIYQSWKERPRVTPASQDRWDAHPHQMETGLRALGTDLVPDQLEIVPTTFSSLRKGEALRLVVAGYLNTREGIYGPFDYRPHPIPSRKWFTDLSTLQGDTLWQRLCKRLYATKSMLFRSEA